MRRYANREIFRAPGSFRWSVSLCPPLGLPGADRGPGFPNSHDGKLEGRPGSHRRQSRAVRECDGERAERPIVRSTALTWSPGAMSMSPTPCRPLQPGEHVLRANGVVKGAHASGAWSSSADFCGGRWTAAGSIKAWWTPPAARLPARGTCTRRRGAALRPDSLPAAGEKRPLVVRAPRRRPRSGPLHLYGHLHLCRRRGRRRGDRSRPGNPRRYQAPLEGACRGEDHTYFCHPHPSRPSPAARTAQEATGAEIWAARGIFRRRLALGEPTSSTPPTTSTMTLTVSWQTASFFRPRLRDQGLGDAGPHDQSSLL